MDPVSLVLLFVLFEAATGGYLSATVGGAVAAAGRSAWREVAGSAKNSYANRATRLGQSKTGRWRLAAEKRAWNAGQRAQAGVAGLARGGGRALAAGVKAAPDGARQWRQSRRWTFGDVAGGLRRGVDVGRGRPPVADEPLEEPPPVEPVEGAKPFIPPAWQERIEQVRGPRCNCCGMFHGRALRLGEHCDWCREHDEPEPTWVPDGTGVQSNGDCGGDGQAGDSYSVRYRREDQPGALTTVSFYPENINDDEDGKPEYAVTQKTEWLVCTDPDDPGGTELWSDDDYQTFGERYETAEEAEQAAKRFAGEHRPDEVTWDGRPEWESTEHKSPATDAGEKEEQVSTDLSGCAEDRGVKPYVEGWDGEVGGTERLVAEISAIRDRIAAAVEANKRHDPDGAEDVAGAWTAFVEAGVRAGEMTDSHTDGLHQKWDTTIEHLNSTGAESAQELVGAH